LRDARLILEFSIQTSRQDQWLYVELEAKVRIKTGFGTVVLVAMLAGTAGAQMWPAACGKEDVQFKVKTDKKAPVPGAPEAGKAQIIFVEAVKGPFGTAPVARFGVDGAWVGADRGTSYFVVSVDPGEHQLCASRQSPVRSERQDVGKATVHAEAGQVYYYKFKIERIEIGYRSTADGGGAGMGGGGSMVGNTPNMTARDLPTTDSIDFTTLTEDEWKNVMKTAAASTSVAKH
jgi:hypothetical protein